MRFYSKAKKLIELKKKTKKINIPETLLFNVFEYTKNPEKVLTKIQKKFPNLKIAIRSSSKDEDTSNKSMAGKFKSFLNDMKLSIKNYNQNV